jgi:hypothetical protein
MHREAKVSSKTCACRVCLGPMCSLRTRKGGRNDSSVEFGNRVTEWVDHEFMKTMQHANGLMRHT